MTKGEKISRSRKSWWAKKKEEDPSFVAERVTALNQGQRTKNRERAERNLPSNALRIELRNQQHWYVFLCEECGVNEVFRPCYYFFDCLERLKLPDRFYKKYAKRIARIRCRRCSNTHNWDSVRKPFESLYNLLKTRRSDTSLTLEEFIEFTKIKTCHYCDRQVVWAPRGGRGATNLDRKDGSKGYARENCVVCCGECNRIKSDEYSYDEMILIGKFLKKLRRN